MRKFAVVLFLTICVVPFSHGQTSPKATLGVDYPIRVHISGIHIRTHCGSFSRSCDEVLYADATLNGKKVDLMGEVTLIAPGDYMAELAKKSPTSGLQEIGQKYKIFLPDQTIWRCTVAGFSE